MTKAYTPDSSPEELEKLQADIVTLARFLNTHPQARHLLLEAQAGRITKHDCVMRLMQLGTPFPEEFLK